MDAQDERAGRVVDASMKEAGYMAALIRARKVDMGAFLGELLELIPWPPLQHGAEMVCPACKRPRETQHRRDPDLRW